MGVFNRLNALLVSITLCLSRIGDYGELKLEFKVSKLLINLSVNAINPLNSFRYLPKESLKKRVYLLKPNFYQHIIAYM